MEIKFPYTITTRGEKITFLGTRIKDDIEIPETDTEVQPKAGPPIISITGRMKALLLCPGKWPIKSQGKNRSTLMPERLS